MSYRFESKILGRLVTIRPNPSGRYEVSMQGRGGLEVRPETFGNLEEAKIGAHGFVHSTLQEPCRCGQIVWMISVDTA